MRINDLCSFYSEDHKFTEEYIYQNKGEYPVYSATLSKPYGYCNSYKYDFPMLLVVNYGDAGKTRIVSGLYNIGRNVSGLTIKSEYENELNLKYLNLILTSILENMADKGNMGCISQQALKDVNLPYPFPSIQEQNEIIEQYEKLLILRDMLNRKVREIKDIRSMIFKVDLLEQSSSLKWKDIFLIYGGNSLLTEEVIYQNQPKNKNDKVKVLSSAINLDTQMGFISNETIIDGKPIKIWDEPIVAISRLGDAGTLTYYNEKVTSTDKAYVLLVKEKYKKLINLKWFKYIGEKYTMDCISNEGSNSTFSKSVFLEKFVDFEIPSIEEQNAIVEQYERLESLELKLAKVLEMINK